MDEVEVEAEVEVKDGGVGVGLGVGWRVIRSQALTRRTREAGKRHDFTKTLSIALGHVSAFPGTFKSADSAQYSRSRA